MGATIESRSFLSYSNYAPLRDKTRRPDAIKERMDSYEKNSKEKAAVYSRKLKASEKDYYHISADVHLTDFFGKYSGLPDLL